jgi:hypothetical protein
MSELDRKALEANFEGWRAERVPDLKPSEAFELYCIGLLLKDADLSDEEIASGHLGGDSDGGVDGFYFFLNRQLMQEETDTPKDVMTAHLWIIQAKNEAGFGEKAIDKMKSFSEDLLDFTKPIAEFKRYGQSVKDAMQVFRTKYEAVLAQSHKFTISYVYASRSDHPPSDNLGELVNQLEKIVRAQVSAVEFDFRYWGARDLITAFRTPVDKTLSIEIENSLPTADGSFICFVKLRNFAKFLTDEKTGEIRQHILEPNVRDYQGPNIQVNKAIRETLGTSDVKEFWWLNNGITILADEPSVGAGKIKLTSPELVNGLQTSFLIFNFFKGGGNDDRTIMVRVIAPPDEQTRRKIIKATNNQTAMSPLSLHATDDIHFNIEELFKLRQLYYERRKGQYRREKKPISKIVSMKDVAQAVIAIALRRPNDARARPETVLKKEDGYEQVFDPQADTRMFLACVLLDRQVQQYLSKRDDLPKDTRTDIRYYMETWLAGVLSTRAEPSKDEIGKLVTTLESPLDVAMLDGCCAWVLEIYQEAGGDDKAAKGTMLPAKLLDYLKGELAGKAKV